MQQRLIEEEPPTYNEPKPSNKITEIFVLRLICRSPIICQGRIAHRKSVNIDIAIEEVESASIKYKEI